MSEWEAYDRLDPIGSWRDDYRSASIQSVMMNIVKMLYPSENATPQQIQESMTSALDFMPHWDQGTPREEREKKGKVQSTDDMLSLMMAIAGTQNKKVLEEEEYKKHLPFNKKQDGRSSE